MAITAQQLRGAAKKYEKLPSHEKVAIDRKVDAMTKEVEQFDADKRRSGEHDMREAIKEGADFAYRKVLNGVGFFRMPDGLKKQLKYCSICEQHDSTMHFKGSKWYCDTHQSIWNLTEQEKQFERSKYNVD